MAVAKLVDIGDRVWVFSLGRWATVVEGDPKNVTVKLDGGEVETRNRKQVKAAYRPGTLALCCLCLTYVSRTARFCPNCQY
jgi:hypothetical protein